MANNQAPVSVIVGAGPGNGRALAHRFAAAGYQVALVARRAESLQRLAAEVEGASVHPADVSNACAIADVFAHIASEHGPVRTLIYNAGAAVFGNVDAISNEDFGRAWQTNALGLLHCARAVIPGMREAGAGEIIVSGATASKKGGANFAAFAAAKAAQHSLAQSLARQLGPEGIHVAVAIIDGVIESERTRKMLPGRESMDFMQSEDIAEAVYQLVRQPRAAWTFELDLRPFRESW